MEWLPWADDPNSFYFLRLTERTRSYGLRNAGSIPVGSVCGVRNTAHKTNKCLLLIEANISSHLLHKDLIWKPD